MRILSAIAVLFLAAPLHGQSENEDSRQVACRFLSFGGNAASPKSVQTKPLKGEGVNCPLPTSQLSPKITCAAYSNTIRFVTEGGKPAGVAKIPSSATAAILLFVPAPADKPDGAPWRVLVIEDSAKNFPDGGAFVANFHSGNIRFVLGEHRGALRPGGLKGYARPSERDTFNMAPVVFQFQQEDKWRIGNESALRFLPGMRYLILAYTDPTSKRPRIRTIQDLLPATS